MQCFFRVVYFSCIPMWPHHTDELRGHFVVCFKWKRGGWISEFEPFLLSLVRENTLVCCLAPTDSIIDIFFCIIYFYLISYITYILLTSGC